jgi:hypothetical protein
MLWAEHVCGSCSATGTAQQTSAWQVFQLTACHYPRLMLGADYSSASTAVGAAADAAPLS